MTDLPPNEIDEYEPSNEDYINRIKYDGDPKVRANAVFVLGRLNDRSALPTMIAALANDTDHDVRLTVLEVLGKFRVPDVVQPLLKALDSDNVDMRAMAVKSLGLAGQSDMLDPLLNALGDESAQVRAQAAAALGEIKAEAAVDVLVNTLVADNDSNVRYFAIGSLVAIGGKTVLESLCNRLNRESHVGILIDLIETIAKLKDPAALDRLRSYATHEEGDVSSTAKWAIGVLEKLQ